MSLLVAVASAAALTGAALFTVNQASCAHPASYVRTEGQVQLIGGCVDPAELPTTKPGRSTERPDLESGFYQP
ncbi:MAG: hypothetical protein ACRDQB_01435 [Thermocrispum sp.]